MRERAIVLHGMLDPAGSPDEQDTLVQVREIAEHLEELDFSIGIRAVGLDLSMLDELATDPPAIIVNLVEAIGGDGRLAHLPVTVLEVRAAPFTGARAQAIVVSNDKVLTKRLLRAAGLTTPAWSPTGDNVDPDRLYIVKSIYEHASLGLDAGSVVPGREVRERLAFCRTRFGGEWFAEAFIAGREFNISLLEDEDGPTVLPIGEIDFTNYPADRPRIVDYDAKWTPDAATYHTTPRTFAKLSRDEPLHAQLIETGLETWRLFGLTGYARVDVRVDERGHVYVLEVNTNPCLSADAGFLAAAAEAGLSGREVVRRIVAAGRRCRW